MVKQEKRRLDGGRGSGYRRFCLQKEQETHSSSLANHQHIQAENPQQEEFQSFLKSC